MRNWIHDFIFSLQVTILMLWPPMYSYDRLLRFCHRALRSRPTAETPRLFLADLHFDYSKFAEARTELESLANGGYSTSRTRRRLGIACYRLGDYTAALKHLNGLRELYNTDVEFNAYLGMSQAYAGAYLDAIPLLLRIVEVLNSGPTTKAVYEALGFSFFQSGEFAKSAEYYRKAAFISPNSIEPRNNAARAHVQIANRLLEENRPQDAADEFRRALQICPDATILAAVSRTLDSIDLDESPRNSIQ